jgi:hypothetical protein
MNVALVFLIILIIVIVALILIHSSGNFDKPESLTNKNPTGVQKQLNSTQSSFTPAPTWSQAEPFPGNTGAGICSIYTFIAGKDTPAAPSYSLLNKGNRDYIIQPSNDFVCIDADQLFAYTISHQCVNPQGSSSGAGCILTVPTYSAGNILKPGEYAPLGTIEGDNNIGTGILYSSLMYAQCTPTNLSNNKNNIPNCQGDIGLIIPQFTPQDNYKDDSNSCLSGLWYNGQTGIGTFDTGIENCNLSESTQIFRTIRYSKTPDGIIQDDKGPLAAIIHRYTGYYLAPDVQYIPGSTGTPAYIYEFQSPNISYTPVTDNYGNVFPTSIKLQLINPNYDTYRNGIYWLLQNQTINPAYNPQRLNFNSYRDVGIFSNQFDYSIVYPQGPIPKSVYFQNTFDYCKANTGATGCATNPAVDIIPDNQVLGSCYYTDGTIDGAIGIVENIPIPIAPQQILYVPDVDLLPDTNTTSIWTYLVNTYSINITNGNTPILTPYRQDSQIDITYECVQDNPTNPDNYFTVPIDIKFQEPYKDSQFINYNSIVQQIQIAVSQNSPGNNTNYEGKYNPFNT